MDMSLFNKIKVAIWFMGSSFYLDLSFISVSSWPASKKFEFLAKKYYLLLLFTTGLKKFKLGRSFVVLFGKKIFFDSRYGLTDYQSMLVRHQRMIKFAGIKELGTVVDVGANVGFFSLMVRDTFPKANIYALEPIPQTFSCLTANLSASGDHVFNFAVSDSAEPIKMSFNEADSSVSHVDSNGLVAVQSLTLNTFCENNGLNEIDLLKIDTEGFEAHVLRGAGKILPKTRYLHLEITTGGNSRYTFSGINGLLCSNDYNFQLICFRNYSNKGEGPILVGDFFYKNIKYS